MARGQNAKRPPTGGTQGASGGMGAGGGILMIDPSPMTNIPSLPTPIVASSSTAPNKRPATSSLALKTRRYIDININDVRNERARGKWTEEDDRMWKRTKPYECEICGERGSTRYNIENRHKVNRHSPQKVIPCPDCKLMFTRKDNLIKHQKKAHPDKFHSQPHTPPSDVPPPPKTRQRRAAEPHLSTSAKLPAPGAINTRFDGQINYGVDELEGAFRILPIAEDLPSRQTQGLMAKCNPESLPFLPPSLLAHYADYYFSQYTFHPHVPLLHKPTFKPDGILASFLRAVCCVGNIYDPTNRSIGKELWDSGWKVMERWVEKGSEVDNLSDGGFAEILKEELPENSTAAAERRVREGRLCVLQGLVLFEFFGLFAYDRTAEKRARRLHYRCVEIAREHGYLREMELPPNYHDLPLQQQWEIFIEVESRKRTAYSLYILDCNLSLLFNTPRLLRLQELKFLSLPCDDALFEAPTAEEWHRIRRQGDEDYFLLNDGSGVYLRSRGEKILFGAIYKKLVQGEGRIEEEYLGKETRLNDYAAYLMVIGIIMEILALTQRVAEEEEEPNMRTGRGGKTVVIFPQDKSFEIERLRRSLDTLGKLPRFGPVLMVEKARPYDVLKCSLGPDGPFDEMIQVAAPLPLELEGCAKSFYVAWHLAHIMLVIPDRMCLRNEETPLDMHTSWAHILLETKDRLEKVSRFSPGPVPDSQQNPHGLGNSSSSWGQGQSHMLFSQVFEDKIAPHLFAILRFAGKSAGYTFEMWDAEFPTVLAMVFKALVVAWELIVRVGREEEERRNLIQTVPQPLLGFGTRTGGLDYPGTAGMWGIPNPGGDWMYMTSQYDDGGYFPWNPSTTLDNQQYNQEQQDVKPNIHFLQQQHLQQQRGGRTPGENFLQEILAFVKYHERLDGDMELANGGGKELLEWRFLRWMRGVFDEIDGWDVGRAVVRVMDNVLLDDGEDDL